jgi:hypothetical protein
MSGITPVISKQPLGHAENVLPAIKSCGPKTTEEKTDSVYSRSRSEDSSSSEETYWSCDPCDCKGIGPLTQEELLQHTQLILKNKFNYKEEAKESLLLACVGSVDGELEEYTDHTLAVTYMEKMCKVWNDLDMDVRDRRSEKGYSPDTHKALNMVEKSEQYFIESIEKDTSILDICARELEEQGEDLSGVSPEIFIGRAHVFLQWGYTTQQLSLSNGFREEYLLKSETIDKLEAMGYSGVNGHEAYEYYVFDKLPNRSKA